MSGPARQLTWFAQAKADLERLHNDDERLARRALALVTLVEAGRVAGEPLRDMAQYGDLSDCRKIYFGVGAEPTHRITYRHTEDDDLELIEIVAVEQRQDGYVYLLAAHRLGRLPQDTRPKFNRVHQAAIALRAAANKRRDNRPGR